jgi:hypothetical protein
MIKESGIPFGVHITPLSKFENEIPTYSFGNKTIPRCKNKSCGVFINPFAEIHHQGWQCNFCQFENIDDDTHEEIYLKLKQNPGSYEFYANSG